MSTTVSLTTDFLVAEGTDYQCFRHPGDEQYCIKVLNPQRPAGPFWSEVSYCASLRRRGVKFDHIAGFHGLIETNLGRGAIFDLVRDDDAQISRSLENYLQRQDQHINAWAIDAMETLKQDLLRQWIVCHDLNPGNLRVKRLGFDEFRLVVVAGVGHRQLLPLASYSRRLARKRLTRNWNNCYRQWYQPFPAIVNQLQLFSDG